MPDLEDKSQIKIPEPALRRLPWYLAFLKLLREKGETIVSSTQIAKDINIDPSQVAKDLSYVNVSGKTRVGYDVEALIKELGDFLGFSSGHKAFLFGVGSLGGALLLDSGLDQYGLDIVAGFDVDRKKIGTKKGSVPIYHINDFPALREQMKVDIAVLTVPVDKAQGVADFIIEGGIKAIWNFTPFRIRIPEEIVVQNTSIYAHLAVMFNRLSSFGNK